MKYDVLGMDMCERGFYIYECGWPGAIIGMNEYFELRARER